MKIESITKETVFYVDLHRTNDNAYLGNFHFIRVSDLNEDSKWYIDYCDWYDNSGLSPQEAAPLEKAYIDYVERTFNGCT